MSKFIFSGIQEGDDKDFRQLFFNPPLVVEFKIYDRIDKETGKQNYPDEYPRLAFATFDFGMSVEIPVTPEHNPIVNSYEEGLTKDSPEEDILMKTITFDLFHAFFHYQQDPNYSHYHWALIGWLQNRTTIKESN